MRFHPSTCWKPVWILQKMHYVPFLSPINKSTNANYLLTQYYCLGREQFPKQTFARQPPELFMHYVRSHQSSPGCVENETNYHTFFLCRLFGLTRHTSAIFWSTAKRVQDLFTGIILLTFLVTVIFCAVCKRKGHTLGISSVHFPSQQNKIWHWQW